MLVEKKKEKTMFKLVIVIIYREQFCSSWKNMRNILWESRQIFAAEHEALRGLAAVDQPGDQDIAVHADVPSMAGKGVHFDRSPGNQFLPQLRKLITLQIENTQNKKYSIQHYSVQFWNNSVITIIVWGNFHFQTTH